MYWIKFIFRQLILTLYDDFEFKYISLPRVWCAISGICVMIALFTELIFGIKFSAWTQLVSWTTACLGAYGIKKYTEGSK